MCKIPNVVVPEDYNLREQQEACGENVCLVECPACESTYFDYGGMEVVQCDCSFQFAVDWYDMFVRGINDGRTINASKSELSGGMKLRMDNPYYKTGFENHSNQAWDERLRHDWRVATRGWKQAKWDRTTIICERCGKKSDSKNVLGECMRCTAKTECKYRCSMMEDTCKAGVNFSELRATNPGLGYSLPCYYVAGTTRIHCDKFVAKSVEEIKSEEDAFDLAIARMIDNMSLIEEIRSEYAGRDWCGIKACPVCNNKLHFGHVGFNGHVKIQCETAGCLNFME